MPLSVRLSRRHPDGAFEAIIVAFRIENAELKSVLDKAFRQRGGQGGFADAGTAGDQDRVGRRQISTVVAADRTEQDAVTAAFRPNSRSRLTSFSISSSTPSPRAPLVTRSAVSLTAAKALSTATLSRRPAGRHGRFQRRRSRRHCAATALAPSMRPPARSPC